MAVSADFRTTSVPMAEAVSRLDDRRDAVEPRSAPLPFAWRMVIVAIGAVLAWVPVVWVLELG